MVSGADQEVLAGLLRIAHSTSIFARPEPVAPESAPVAAAACGSRNMTGRRWRSSGVGDRRKFGNKSVRAYLDAGWEVYPINSRGGRSRAYPPALDRDVSGPLKRVSLYLRRKLESMSCRPIAAARPAEFFVNPGRKARNC